MQPCVWFCKLRIYDRLDNPTPDFYLKPFLHWGGYITIFGDPISPPIISTKP